MLEFGRAGGVRSLGVYQVDSRGGIGERQPDATSQVLLSRFEARTFASLVGVNNWGEVDPSTIDWFEEFPFGPALFDVLELAVSALRDAGTPITASADWTVVGAGTPIFGARGGRARACARGRGVGRGDGRGIVGTSAVRRTVTTVSAEVDELRQEIAMLRSRAPQPGLQEPPPDRDVRGPRGNQPAYDRLQPSAADAARDLESRFRVTLDAHGSRVAAPFAEGIQPRRARASLHSSAARSAGREEKEDQLLASALRGCDDGREAIRQGFKAFEKGHRDRSDWTPAWLCTNLPDPRPPRRFARGLSHPSEHSAGVAYIREMQALQSHHEEVLDDEWHRGRKSEGNWKGKDQGKGDDHGHKRAPDNKAKEQGHGGGGRGRGDGGRGGAGGRGGGAGDAPSAQ